mgnify:CR=1 FL=1
MTLNARSIDPSKFATTKKIQGALGRTSGRVHPAGGRIAKPVKGLQIKPKHYKKSGSTILKRPTGGRLHPSIGRKGVVPRKFKEYLKNPRKRLKK